MTLDDKQYLLTQQSPPWMSTKKSGIDTPEWVNRDEVDNFIQQTRNMMLAGPKEHVIPIAVEPTPTKTPATPNFGPTPFYGAGQQQFNNVVSPKVGKFWTQSQRLSESSNISLLPYRSKCESICQSRIQQHRIFSATTIENCCSNSKAATAATVSTTTTTAVSTTTAATVSTTTTTTTTTVSTTTTTTTIPATSWHSDYSDSIRRFKITAA